MAHAARRFPDCVSTAPLNPISLLSQTSKFYFLSVLIRSWFFEVNLFKILVSSLTISAPLEVPMFVPLFSFVPANFRWFNLIAFCLCIAVNPFYNYRPPVRLCMMILLCWCCGSAMEINELNILHPKNPSFNFTIDTLATSFFLWFQR